MGRVCPVVLRVELPERRCAYLSLRRRELSLEGALISLKLLIQLFFSSQDPLVVREVPVDWVA